MSDMGSGEMGTPTKTTKTSTAQPASSAPMSYPEWAAAFQAYYSSGTTPLPPPGYFPTSVASGPQPHPYMWGAQPLMPPYGTPPPYAAMYPHGGLYAHPSMPPGSHPYSPYALSAGTPNDAPGAVAVVGTDPEGKALEGKERSPMKRSKGSLGSLGMLTGKGSEVGKGTSGSMNGVYSQSGDSGSEGSSEGSEGNSQNGGQIHKGNSNHVNSDAPVGQVVNSAAFGNVHDINQPVAAVPISMAGKHVVGAGPMTNLNIGMDYWSGAAVTGTVGATRGKGGPAAVTTAMIPATPMLGAGRDGVPTELWLQDERELKRQRRKQSNRESARRSRLRKQAECEELAAKVESLTAENLSLRTELNHISEQCKKLSADNSSLMEKLQMRRSREEEAQGEVEEDDMKSEKTGKDTDQEGGLAHVQRDSRVEDETPDLVRKPDLAQDGRDYTVSASTV